ncbi:hypothetical protein N9F34_00250 [Alphaproteobacteria bacterium]|nr:hypothetical protein [Alphaproteobacteria bacterium]
MMLVFSEMPKLRLVLVAMDAEGVIPDALACAYRQHGFLAYYTMATMHEPTCTKMSLEQRHHIGHVASNNDLLIVEGDIKRFLVVHGEF